MCRSGEIVPQQCNCSGAEDYATAYLRQGRKKIYSGKIVPQQCIPKSRDKICSGTEDYATAELREGREKIYSGKIVPQQCNCSGAEKVKEIVLFMKIMSQQCNCSGAELRNYAAAVQPEKSGQDLQRC